MATCKECICYESCLDFAEMIGKNIVESITDGHYRCEFFKGRARFVELPCNVGDSVFTIDKKGNIKECTVITVNCKTQMTSDKKLWTDFIIATEPVNDSLPFPMIFTYSIAKNHILFLTRESAEKALKEHEK